MLVALILLTTGSIYSSPAPARSCEQEIHLAASQYDVPIGVLYSVGLTETGHKGQLQPHALNIDGQSVRSRNAREALAKFRTALSAGARFVDIGCMQINHHYHGMNFASVSDMLDPRQNVRYAARFLKQLKDTHQTWTMAIARYHAGPDNEPAQRKYLCRVIANLVTSGYGKWTKDARRFCR